MNLQLEPNGHFPLPRFALALLSPVAFSEPMLENQLVVVSAPSDEAEQAQADLSELGYMRLLRPSLRCTALAVDTFPA